MFFKDAARALVQLAEAPLHNIHMVNYVIAGPTQIPSTGELAELVRVKVPGAQIDFKPDPQLQATVAFRLLDDSKARQEWNWKPYYDQERIVDDFLCEL
jgi:nucleoside-diphosphate-sugar epimerase